MKTTTRLKMLSAAILEHKLEHSELKIYWYLLLELTNSHSSACYCSNEHLEKKLCLSRATVKRAKLQLKAKGLIDWQPGKRGSSTNPISSYRFYKRFYGSPTSPIRALDEPHHKGLAHEPPPRTIYLSFASSELQIQSDWERKTRGTEGPRDRSGGWRYKPHQLAPELRQ